MDLLDTAWCPVCDRQIPPEILTAPPTPASPSASPQTNQPIKTRGGTIKAAPGSRRGPMAHLRSKSAAAVPQVQAQPSTSSPPKKEAKPRTYISQAPTPLYCSPECQLRDSMSSLCVSIPSSPTEAKYAAFGRPAPPSSPIMISGSSSSSDAGGSYGSPFSTNSEYFAYLEGRPRRQSHDQPNTGSSAESLSSLNQPTRHLPPTRNADSRSRRPSSSSLAPRPLHSTGYAHSPPTEGKQYTLSFTRAPASTASPSSSPPAISIMPAYASRRDRSASRASSSLREAAGLALPMSPAPSIRSMTRSSSDMTSTPRPFSPIESRSRPTRRKDISPDSGVKILPLKEEEESKWWSWNGYNVPTYEAMPSRSTPDGQRKRMFYFQQ
ncbi:hypothetical protein DACRYDRAFT_24369 [Dacryopinax primogenitus]|uniref:Uncharacterized protein n=1 Tax=Dacryopinax primogenitus (strain DJM 731) TaxID=1858805 RepID=M5G507_DACPD|nr:uncharacterized protein DACRYDRAFT_24369 [Dacryopinax primogenitus]EJT98837.1 hypothetical protein DACRYDRAFT_24369 [Dacryopinax primogenitus]